MIRVTDAANYKGKLTVFFKASDDHWSLTPGTVLRSGDITIKYKRMGLVRSGATDLYAFLGESDHPPETLIGRDYEILQ